MPPFVTYALLALCLALFAFGFWVDGRRGRALFPKLRRLALVMQLAAIVAAYFVLRPGHGNGASTMSASLAKQQPVMIDLYSNY